MATPQNPRALIGARRREIEEDMDRLRNTIGAAHTALEQRRHDLAELEIAERVWATLEPKPQPVATVFDDSAAHPSRKPAGTPSVPHMILAALHEAKRHRVRGLGPKEMVAFIAQQWWEAVTINDIGPIAWRMWKRQGLLQKEGGKYLLPEPVQASLVAEETTEKEVADKHMAA